MCLLEFFVFHTHIADNADNTYDYNRMTGIAQVKAFSSANKCDKRK